MILFQSHRVVFNVVKANFNLIMALSSLSRGRFEGRVDRPRSN